MLNSIVIFVTILFYVINCEEKIGDVIKSKTLKELSKLDHDVLR